MGAVRVMGQDSLALWGREGHMAGQASIMGPPSQPRAAASSLSNNSVSACFMDLKWEKGKGTGCAASAENGRSPKITPYQWNGVSVPRPPLPMAWPGLKQGSDSLPISLCVEQQTPQALSVFNQRDEAQSPGTEAMVPDSQGNSS